MEQFCLKWGDFQENIHSSFKEFRKEDGSQFEAHKVILSASSPFFQKLLKKNKHPHPLSIWGGEEQKIYSRCLISCTLERQKFSMKIENFDVYFPYYCWRAGVSIISEIWVFYKVIIRDLSFFYKVILRDLSFFIK